MKKGILALLGSGEFTPAVLQIDEFLLSKISNPRVAIIPTAAGQEKDFYKWIEDGVKHFRSLGVNAQGLEVLTQKDANDSEILKKIEEFNFFYFSGGDPGYLLDVLKDSKVWKLIYQKYLNGAVLAGSSAGAMVLGKKVWARVYEYMKTGVLKGWEEGLGVIDFGIVPHFDKLQKDFSKEEFDKFVGSIPKDLTVYGIDEDTGYINVDGNWASMGKGQVYKISS